MSAPQPPTNGDEPTTGAGATDGRAPASVPQPPQAESAQRKAAPRKTTTGKSTTGKTVAGTTIPVTGGTRKTTAGATTTSTGATGKTTAGARAPRQSTARVSPETPPASAVPDETAETKVLPTVAETEVLPAATETPAPATLDSEVVPVEATISTPAEPLAAQSPDQPSTPASDQPTAVPKPGEQAQPEQPAADQRSTNEPPAAHQAAPPARTISEVFAERLENDGFFSALFDFTFTRYVTRKLAGPVYVVGLVLIGLSTILSLGYWLGQAIATQSFLGAFVFLFGLIITIVGSALAILLLRVAIEVFVAIVAIAENTRPRRKQGP